MLGKGVYELLEEMPPDEFFEWLAYVEVRNKRMEDARKKAQRKGRRGGSKGHA